MIPRLRAPVRSVLAIVSLTTVVLVGAVAPASAGIVTGTFLSGTGSTPVSGLTRTRLEVFAASSPQGATIGLDLAFRNAGGTAVATDTLQLNAGKVSCTAQLTSCTIDDQGGLGTYGRIDLAFTATGPKVKRNVVCFGTDIVYATEVARKGVLSGTLRLDTKSKKLGTIRNRGTGTRVAASIPFRMKRTVYNGSGCPTSAVTCGERIMVGSEDFTVQASRTYTGTKRGQTFLVRTLPSADPDIDRTVTVSAEGAGTAALTVQTKSTIETATFGLGISAPFLSGSVVATGTSDLFTVKRFGCDAHERSVTFAGTLTWRTPGRPKVTKPVAQSGSIIHLLGTVAP